MRKRPGRRVTAMRSLLFVPADSERKIARGLASGADVVILDLEDSVAAANKPAARRLAAEVLGRQRAKAPMLIVRLNALGSGLIEADLEAVMPAAPDGIMQPKTRRRRGREGACRHGGLAAMAGSGGWRSLPSPPRRRARCSASKPTPTRSRRLPASPGGRKTCRTTSGLRRAATRKAG
jgi:hypothetical protein